MATARAGPEPVGVDAREEPEHEAVRGELAKLESPSLGVPNWTLVAAEGGKLLQHKSKDFVIACQVAGPLLEVRGVAGAASGLVVVNGLARDFWQTAPPGPQPNSQSGFSIKLAPTQKQECRLGSQFAFVASAFKADHFGACAAGCP